MAGTTIEIDDELRSICRSLVAEGRSEAEWAEIEADDWVHSQLYAGGFDATECAFCFSRYGLGEELWFQFTLAEAGAIADGQLLSLPARPAS